MNRAYLINGHLEILLLDRNYLRHIHKTKTIMISKANRKRSETLTTKKEEKMRENKAK